MITPGVQLSGRYRLTRRIAVGGMGEVWVADDQRLARTVAVKILRPELTDNPEFVQRFRTEARITAALNHPGICAVYDYGEALIGPPGAARHQQTDTAYLVMELIAGEPLSAILAHQGRLSPSRTLDLLDQTGRALQVAHALSLVHRDIKPGNLLITPGGQVKITDFGIAKVAHQVPVTRTGLVMGTAQYISPEQASGREAVPASDIYALGCVAYECLAGRLPFTGENSVAMAMAHVRDAPAPLPRDVPPPVAQLVMQMLVKDPAARFPNGAALCHAIGRVRAGVMPAAAPAGPRPRATSVLPAAPPTPARAGQVVRVAPPMARPQPAYPPATSGRMPIQSAAPRRHTGLSVLIALLVVLLIVVIAVVVDRRVAELSAPGVAAAGPTDPGTLKGAPSIWNDHQPGWAWTDQLPTPTRGENPSTQDPRILPLRGLR
jgi:eukaryotic-like serine/threonine-protein kinase